MSVFSSRPATLRDAKAIAEIHVASWQQAYKGILSDEHLDSLSLDKRQAFWREAIDLCEPQVVVVSDGTQIAGFVAFDRSRDKGTPSSTGEIWAIYVHPKYWGRGAGLALWDAAR
ncbi:MAG: GNAT family N-acetyltransferase, partial [Burkholderiaceae bacterium]